MSNADLIKALRSCQQYDADGVMCVVSLRACVEAADALEAQEWRTDMENAPHNTPIKVSFGKVVRIANQSRAIGK